MDQHAVGSKGSAIFLSQDAHTMSLDGPATLNKSLMEDDMVSYHEK